MRLLKFLGVGTVLLAALVAGGSPTFARSEHEHTRARSEHEHTRTYLITLRNLTHGQPFSPPVAATNRTSVHMFQVGRIASDELAHIARDGNEVPMATLLRTSDRVTDVVDVGRPLTPAGKTVGSFTDTVTFEITAEPGDRFSLATMLICTNDGFLGVDNVKLPKDDTKTLDLRGYDAGRENNTELSADIVDACSALGPVQLTGDPNGNNDATVATIPPQPIALHPGIKGIGDLSVAEHGWHDPVARLTIERVD